MKLHELTTFHPYEYPLHVGYKKRTKVETLARFFNPYPMKTAFNVLSPVF